MSWSEITLRVVFSFLVLLLMTRLMGKVHLSQLTFFDYVTGITIGSLAAAAVTDTTLELTKGIYALILWSVLNILIEYVTLKFNKSRVLLDGRPSILIKQGYIDEKALSKAKINMDELNMMLRSKDVFDITQVYYAILENSGDLTVLKKAEFDNVSKKDLSVSIKQNKNIPMQIINKGKIIESVLNELDLDKDWVNKEVKRLGYKSIDDVFYGGISEGKNFFVVPVCKK